MSPRLRRLGAGPSVLLGGGFAPLGAATCPSLRAALGGFSAFLALTTATLDAARVPRFPGPTTAVALLLATALAPFSAGSIALRAAGPAPPGFAGGLSARLAGRSTLSPFTLAVLRAPRLALLSPPLAGGLPLSVPRLSTDLALPTGLLPAARGRPAGSRPLPSLRFARTAGLFLRAVVSPSALAVLPTPFAVLAAPTRLLPSRCLAPLAPLLPRTGLAVLRSLSAALLPGPPFRLPGLVTGPAALAAAALTALLAPAVRLPLAPLTGHLALLADLLALLTGLLPERPGFLLARSLLFPASSFPLSSAIASHRSVSSPAGATRRRVDPSRCPLLSSPGSPASRVLCLGPL